MAMLLALTMILSVVPATLLTANAAVGDIYDDRETTGLTGDINTKDTISWPIKIYDYLNDGMLFEYSSAQDTGLWPSTGGSYGGGKAMPMIGNTIGEDYTSVAGYYNVTTYYNDYGYVTGYGYENKKYSLSNWRNSAGAYSNYYDSDNSEVVRSIKQPVDWVSPMSLHLEYTKPDATSQSYGWVSNFARDDGKYYTGDQVRYMVIVYKTNDAYNQHNIQPYWAVSDSSYSADDSAHGGTIDISYMTDYFGRNNNGMLMAEEVAIPKSTQWTYKIVDMKSNYADNTAIGIKNNWKLDWDNDGDTDLNLSTQERVAGVGMSLPLAAEGEEMDISHIAYFGSAEEAENFGQMAVEFDNEPGEYIGYTITGSGASGTSTSPAPTMGASGSWDFTTTGSNGWSNYIYKTTWSDSNHGITKTQMNGPGYTYTNITCPDSSLDTATLWTNSTLVNLSLRRYITIVYRVYGNSAPTIGFWAADSAGWYAGGKGVLDTTYASTCRVNIPVQEGNKWVAFTYDLRWLEDKFHYEVDGNITTIDFIGIKFPGFTIPPTRCCTSITTAPVCICSM